MSTGGTASRRPEPQCLEVLEPRLLLAGDLAVVPAGGPPGDGAANWLPLTMTTAEGFAYFHCDGVSRDNQTLYDSLGGAVVEGDHDIAAFSFAGDKGWSGTYAIRVDAPAWSGVDPILAVYDAKTGQQLGFDDDSGGGTSAFLKLELDERTRYILAAADDDGTETGDIDVTITAPSGTSPTPISLDANGNGQRVGLDVLYANDSAFFAFTSPADASGKLDVTVHPAASMDVAAVLFDAAGQEIAKAYLNGGGIDETIHVEGLRPSTDYFLTVVPKGYFDPVDGRYDVAVDFGQIVPDELPADVSHFARAPNASGDGTATFATGEGWTGWVFASPAVSAGATLRVTATGDAAPLLGLYDRATGQRLAWDANLAGASTAEITFDVMPLRAYELITRPQSPAGGMLSLSIDLAGPATMSEPRIDAEGCATVPLVLHSPAGIAYLRLVAPPIASGELTVTLHDAEASVQGGLNLFDAATGRLLGLAEAPAPGGDATITQAGIEPGQAYDLAVYTGWFDGGTGNCTIDVEFSLALPGEMTAADAEGFAYVDHDEAVHDSLSVDAWIEAPGNVDAYVFAGDFGCVPRVVRATAPAGSEVSPALAVYNATTGERIGAASAAGGSEASTPALLLCSHTAHVVAVADTTGTHTGDVAIETAPAVSGATKPVGLDAAGNGHLSGESLYARHTNFYRFTAPDDADGHLEVLVAPAAPLDAAAALFDASGQMLGEAHAAAAGAVETLPLDGLAAGETYYLSVMADRHESTGTFDLSVNFEQILPETLPAMPRTMQLPNQAGYGTLFAGFTWDQWAGWAFGSDVDSPGALFRVTAAGGGVPVLGLYDRDTGERLAANVNPGNADQVEIAFDIDKWTRYQLITKDKSGGAGYWPVTVDMVPAGYRDAPALDASGHGASAGALADPADIEYFRLVAPEAATGELTVTLHDVAADLAAALWLLDPVTGEARGSAGTILKGEDIVYTRRGVQPGEVLDLAVTSYWQDGGTGSFEVDVDFGLSVPTTLGEAAGFAYFHCDGVSHDTQTYSTHEADAAIHAPGEVAAFSFAGDALWTGEYAFRASSPLDSEVEPVLAVYDPETGERLGFDGPGPVGSSYLALELAPQKRYIVAVADDDGLDTGEVAIRIEAPGSDVPVEIALDSHGDGSHIGIEALSQGDSDFFRFTSPADANGVLELTVRPAAGLDAAAVLLDAEGSEIAKAYLASAGADETLTVSGLAPSTDYYLTVLAADYATTGAYDVIVNFAQLMPLTIDPADADFGWPRPSQLGRQTMVHALVAGTGPLIMAIRPEAAGTVTVEMISYDFAPVAALYGPMGKRLAWGAAGAGETASLKATAGAGTSYVYCTAGPGPASGQFTLDLTVPPFPAVEDVKIDPAEGVGGREGEQVDPLADQDFFRIEAPSDALSVAIAMTPTSTDLLPYLRLYDEAGRLLASEFRLQPGQAAAISFAALKPGASYVIGAGGAQTATGGYDLAVDFHLPLQVARSTLADGDVLLAGRALEYGARFNEAPNATLLGKDDFELLDPSGKPVPVKDWRYDADEHALIIDYPELAFGHYRLRVFDSVRDMLGDPLDGDIDGQPGGDFSLSFAATLPGDTDCDGDVDYVDYLAIKSHFGTGPGATWHDGDFDGDADVDYQDYRAGEGNFGWSVSGGAAAQIASPPAQPPDEAAAEGDRVQTLAAAVGRLGGAASTARADGTRAAGAAVNPAEDGTPRPIEAFAGQHAADSAPRDGVAARRRHRLPVPVSQAGLEVHERERAGDGEQGPGQALGWLGLADPAHRFRLRTADDLVPKPLP